MRVVQIPGGTALLREKGDLKQGHRRLIETAALAAGDVLHRLGENPPKEQLAAMRLSWEDSEAVLRLQDATILAVLDSWSLADPVPTMATLGEMDTDLYDALAQATKSLGAEVAKETDFSFSPDHSSPTGGSAPSNTPSTAGSEPASTPTPQAGGVSTATAASTT